MKRVTFAVPGDLATPTGGYVYDRRVIGELRALGWQVDVLDIGDGFPKPGATTLDAAHARLAAASDAPIVIDGLALGVLPQAAADIACQRPLIALVHHPLALESGIAPDDAAAFRMSERAALAAARHVIVTSGSTAELLARDYAVTKGRITVAPPGTDAVTWAEGSGSPETALLAVGSVSPRKGYDVLAAALADLRDLPWRLRIVGDRTRDPTTAAALDAAIAAAGLSDRITLTGPLFDAELAAAYREADLFVMASRFEGYGMAAADAVACGLPIVATTGGALAQTLAGIACLVPPGDSPALAASLRAVLTDGALRERLCAASRAAAGRLPTWHDTALAVARGIAAAT